MRFTGISPEEMAHEFSALNTLLMVSQTTVVFFAYRYSSRALCRKGLVIQVQHRLRAFVGTPFLPACASPTATGLIRGVVEVSSVRTYDIMGLTSNCLCSDFEAALLAGVCTDYCCTVL